MLVQLTEIGVDKTLRLEINDVMNSILVGDYVMMLCVLLEIVQGLQCTMS